MTTMLRITSFVMMILLTAPMVRECCLPVTHALPCHESKQTDDVTCASNQQAITESKTVAALRSSIVSTQPVTNFAAPERITEIRAAENVFEVAYPPPTDIYLRTGALLI